LATGSILLNPGAAIMPDGSASNLAPAIQRSKSSATAPAPYFLQFAFDAANLEAVMWQFRMPADYASACILKVVFKMVSATTGNVIINGAIAAYTPGTDTTDFDAKAFAAANVSAATAVPATTAGKLGEISLTLSTDDSVAAGDMVALYLARDGANASDTAAGDMEVTGVALTYTTV
jgi:hypothetical protein